ncbi:MAG: peptidase MA family metallohydrolase, partial [Anaerolineales bacterium]|nr:peptidase MA family metallohydrolase [Anaerolineales bacterium]
MKTLLFAVLSGMLALSPARVRPAQIDIARNEAEASFPNAITFYLTASSPASIESVELEFGTDATACGESTARVVPDDFVPGTTVATEWTWDLRRTGALPPGTEVWWRWIVQDSAGGELTTPDQSIVVEDTQRSWRNTASDPIDLYWYTGDNRFADTLMGAAQAALVTIREATGVEYDGDIRLYVYGDSTEMQSATLFAPDWSGGLAFPEHSAVLAAIAPNELAWGQRAVAHELTHVVLGQYTFSCLDSTPTWVTEGLAMYAEGEPEEGLLSSLEEAVQEGTLLPVRSLSQGFSNDPYLSYLAYAQSYSLVDFLVGEYGPERMIALLDQFRQGSTEDQALQRVYAFDRDGLDAAWRTSIGAAESQGAVPAEGKPTPTPYPTFAPLGAPNAGAATSVVSALTAAATPIPATDETKPSGKAPPGLCAAPAAIGVVGLGLMLLPRAQRRAGA